MRLVEFPLLYELIGPVFELWISEHRQIASMMRLWRKHGIRFGVFCSQSVWISNQVTRASPCDEPDDIDILVTKEDFGRAVKLLPNAKVVKVKSRQKTRDGYIQICSLTEVKCRIGNSEVHFMYPHDDILCFKDNKSHHNYRWHFSNFAYENCLMLETNYGLLSVTHPFDTIALYAIIQRAHKDDLVKTASLISLLKLWPETKGDPYSQIRSAELGLDMRAGRFMQNAVWRSLTGVLDTIGNKKLSEQAFDSAV